ncbi:hypothetical protein BV898_13488 [Hypsibius exemplaris]|uniref:Letm1 RBD domain-containing protein n=1 Tax=Hypsibius exemplaris TaxID=2072580 RepID=A0A1W0WAI4_HYPEX|nr:hypothetical protein BV898_13488 [Hypsibius exemplaris]
MQSLRSLYTPIGRVVNSYNAFLHKNYPKLYDLQTAIVHGTKKTFSDSRDYAIASSRYVQGKPLEYRLAVVRWQYPRDLLKLSPVLALLLIPFSSIALLPLVYFFPGMFTRHFWTEDERKRFVARKVRRRLSVVEPELLPFISRSIEKLEKRQEQELMWYAVGRVKEGAVLTAEEVRDMEPIFTRYPFAREHLPNDVVWNLAWLNNTLPWSLRRFCVHLSEMDKLLERNGLAQLTVPEVRHAVLIRCGNGNAEVEDMRNFLQLWIKASNSLADPVVSLRLFLPVFLCYKHPLNREVLVPSNSSTKVRLRS